MTRDEEILARLDRLEAMIAPVAAHAAAMNELKEELTPRVNEAVRALIVELADIESEFQLDKLLRTLKRAARSLDNIEWSLEKLNALVDFVNTAEPLLRGSVPHAIARLDELERSNLFRIAGAKLDALAAAGRGFSDKDLERLQQGVVELVEMSKQLMEPRALALMQHMTAALSRVDLDACGEAGLLDMLKAMKDPQTKRGVAVMLQLTRAMAPAREASQQA